MYLELISGTAKLLTAGLNGGVGAVGVADLVGGDDRQPERRVQLQVVDAQEVAVMTRVNAGERGK